VTNEEILDRLQLAFPSAVTRVTEGVKDFTIAVASERLAEIASFLRDELGFDYLSGVTSVDREERFEVVYYLYSMARQRGPLVLKVYLPDKEDPHLPSVTSVWRGAELQEREVYDLMGIRFDGHPDLRRMFLWEGFPGYPLRKDFVCEWPIETSELVAVKYAASEG